MVPCRDAHAQTERRDNLDAIGTGPLEPELRAAIPGHWQLDAAVARWSGRKTAELHSGMHFRIQARDTITSAPELVRLTLNMAMIHTDGSLSYLDRRMVYGGHTIGIAFAQVTRALPNLITILGWERVEHMGPVTEGDRLRSELTVLEIVPCAAGALLKLMVRTYAAHGDAAEEETAVLEWTLWVLGA